MKAPTAAVLFAMSLAGQNVGACSPFDIHAPPPTNAQADAGEADEAGEADDATTDLMGIDATGPDVTSVDASDLPHFSFFYTSLAAMQRLSGNPKGFGGDLRFGMPTGIEGADKICQTIGAHEGFGAKTWKAFLSATRGPDGQTVHAIERIGEGPWYDRKGRLIARDRAGLLGADRPIGDTEAVNDLPNETGEGTSILGSSYDAVTASNTAGRLYYTDPRNTCMDWTNTTLENVLIMCGHSWLATGVANWIQAHPERSCIPGVNLASNGTSDGSSIGAGGGWGGFYCFALTP